VNAAEDAAWKRGLGDLEKKITGGYGDPAKVGLQTVKRGLTKRKKRKNLGALTYGHKTCKAFAQGTGKTHREGRKGR